MCVANDYAAVAFINTIQRAGVLVPLDVSVVGDDNDPIAAHGVVPLTTIQYPLQEIAQAVIDLLESRLDGSYTGAPRHVVVNGHLVLRDSTAAPHHSKDLSGRPLPATTGKSVSAASTSKRGVSLLKSAAQPVAASSVKKDHPLT
jgi:hypothetical protein